MFWFQFQPLKDTLIDLLHNKTNHLLLFISLNLHKSITKAQQNIVKAQQKIEHTSKNLERQLPSQTIVHTLRKRHQKSFNWNCLRCPQSELATAKRIGTCFAEAKATASLWRSQAEGMAIAKRKLSASRLPLASTKWCRADIDFLS